MADRRTRTNTGLGIRALAAIACAIGALSLGCVSDPPELWSFDRSLGEFEAYSGDGRNEDSIADLHPIEAGLEWATLPLGVLALGADLAALPITLPRDAAVFGAQQLTAGDPSSTTGP